MAADKKVLLESKSSQHDPTWPFLQALAESRVQDEQVKTFLSFFDKYTRSHHLLAPIVFPSDHPVEEVGR